MWVKFKEIATLNWPQLGIALTSFQLENRCPDHLAMLVHTHTTHTHIHTLHAQTQTHTYTQTHTNTDIHYTHKHKNAHQHTHGLDVNTCTHKLHMFDVYTFAHILSLLPSLKVICSFLNKYCLTWWAKETLHMTVCELQCKLNLWHTWAYIIHAHTRTPHTSTQYTWAHLLSVYTSTLLLSLIPSFNVSCCFINRCCLFYWTKETLYMTICKFHCKPNLCTRIHYAYITHTCA